jgi:hypothetical protein
MDFFALVAGAAFDFFLFWGGAIVVVFSFTFSGPFLIACIFSCTRGFSKDPSPSFLQTRGVHPKPQATFHAGCHCSVLLGCLETNGL